MAWLHRSIPCIIVRHPTQNDIGDPGLRVVFPGAFHFPGPCAGRRLGRRRGAERRVGHRCLSEHSERVSMAAAQDPSPSAGARTARATGVPFFGRSKKGTPGSVTARYAGRARSGRLIGAFQRSTLRSGTASLAYRFEVAGCGALRLMKLRPSAKAPTSYPELADLTLDTVRGGVETFFSKLDREQDSIPS